MGVSHFSGFILLAAAGFTAAVVLYCLKSMADRANKNIFYALLLLSVAMVNGAVLADHLVALLFFWEGLLVTLFGMVAVGSREAFKTATKAFIIAGITDLCMMFGIALAGWKAGTLVMSQIHLPLFEVALDGLLMFQQPIQRGAAERVVPWTGSRRARSTSHRNRLHRSGEAIRGRPIRETRPSPSRG